MPTCAQPHSARGCCGLVGLRGVAGEGCHIARLSLPLSLSLSLSRASGQLPFTPHHPNTHAHTHTPARAFVFARLLAPARPLVAPAMAGRATGELSEALVREYLARSPSLAEVAEAFEAARPRTTGALSRSSDVAKRIGLSAQLRRNKQRAPADTLPTLLDVICEHLASKVAGMDTTKEAATSDKDKAQASEQLASDGPAPVRPPVPVRTASWSVSGVPTAGDASAGRAASLLRPSSALAHAAGTRGPAPAPGYKRTLQARVDEALVIEDADDDFDEAPAPGAGAFDVRAPTAAGLGLGSSKPAPAFGAAPGAPGGAGADVEALSVTSARAAKALLFGARGSSAAATNRGWGGPSWRQGLYFCEKTGLKYGLVQAQGGPCGVLAALQAYVLRELGAGATQSAAATGELGASAQLEALAGAVAHILEQAASAKGGACVLVSSPRAFDGEADFDSVLACARAHTCSTRAAARARALEQLSHGGWGEARGHGLLLLVLSVLLSRGVEDARNDMDEPEGSLVGAHGYCTQELVNLLVVGRARAGVHDGERRVDLGGESGPMVMRGVDRRSAVGFLTLFEWYKYVEVGAHLKRALSPIWVVCSESHFTVLWAADASTRADDCSAPAELLYYDGLARQDEPIRLSVRHGGGACATHCVSRVRARAPPVLTRFSPSCVRVTLARARATAQPTRPTTRRRSSA